MTDYIGQKASKVTDKIIYDVGINNNQGQERGGKSRRQRNSLHAPLEMAPECLKVDPFIFE
ncbi:MAG: hypothetical protein WCE94_14655 [Candidatus Methanoperedens sp.]